MGNSRTVKILYQGGSGEIVEKKSRFIATLERVGSEEEATAFLARIRKQYWDARHNCHAFVVGENHELQRCSDDGEPSGTAGRPMLDLLLSEGIHDAAVVVTRYFGGTLLGTGGLVRAYQSAVREGLKHCVVVEKRPGRSLSVGTDYAALGKVRRVLEKEGAGILDIVYTERALVRAMAPEERAGEIAAAVTEATGGAAVPEIGESSWYADVGGEIKIM